MKWDSLKDRESRRFASPWKARTAGYATAALFLAADQLTKILAEGSLASHRSVQVLGNVVRFTLVWNRGAAFSLSWGGPAILGVVTAAAAVLVLVQIWKMTDRPAVFLVGLGAILGGALGNLLDRIMYGSVIDFIDVGFGRSRWPTFNVADIAITVGGILLVLAYWRDGRGSGTREDETEGTGN
jgi:signal peptidase II